MIVIAKKFFSVFITSMKINQINPREIQLNKILSRVESYADKTHLNKAVKPEKFARDLFIAGEKCKTPEKENLLNNCLTSLADKMIDAKQNDLAGIIYSFLIKFNKDNLITLKQLIPKALKIAEMQKDSIHVAARTGELCQIYKTYDIHGANYLACLNLRKKALTDICSNYDTVGERFRTISRQKNDKDTYLELLIKTKYDIANEIIVTDKQNARNELLSAYKDLSQLSDDYKKTKERGYSMLKKHAGMQLTEITLCKNTPFNNTTEKFSKISKNIVDATKEKAPIENSLFDDYYNSMYDEFKQDSLEDKFIYKSLKLVDELENLGNSILADRICNILASKNQNNIRNLKTIILKQLELRDKNNDSFGVFYFCSILQRLFKKDSKAVSVNSYLKALQFDIKTTTNIINNYDNIPQRSNLKPKNEYIKQLIYAKVNAARLQKNTYPEYTNKVIKEVAKLIDELPLGYIAEHPEMESSIRFVRQNNY